MLDSLRRWLAGVPIDDPVDRRNAPFLQVLLAAVGLLVLCNLLIFAYAVGLRGMTPTHGTGLSTLVGEFLVALAAFAAVLLIRRGRLHQAMTLFLATLLLDIPMVYWQRDMDAIVGDPVPLMALGLSGLVLGRRPLWRTFAVFSVICALLSLGHVKRSGGDSLVAFNWLIVILGSYLLITMVLDSTVAALRGSLEEANQRRQEAEAANRQLRHEMAERERMQDALVHAQKMEVVGRLASGVAHDFDNVIAVISGFTGRRERLADRGTEALLDAMEGIDMASRRAHAISRKLLNFSRQATGTPGRVDVAEVLREVLPMMRQLFPSPVRVSLDVEGEAPLPVWIDRGHLEMMVLNIASNARDALGREGSFAVACGVAGDGFVQIRLRDSGPGIPADVLPHIFEPFYTTKPVGQGTGLGLSVVRDMLAAAGGTIHAQVPPEGGTCFVMRLPRMEAGQSAST